MTFDRPLSQNPLFIYIYKYIYILFLYVIKDIKNIIYIIEGLNWLIKTYKGLQK